MAIRVNVKQLRELINSIEDGGGDATLLKNELAALDNNHNSGPGRQVDRFNHVNDDEYLEDMRSQSPLEHGIDLECMLCHNKFDHLINDTCENCFRNWALSAKPKDTYRRV